MKLFEHQIRLKESNGTINVDLVFKNNYSEKLVRGTIKFFEARTGKKIHKLSLQDRLNWWNSPEAKIELIDLNNAYPSQTWLFVNKLEGYTTKMGGEPPLAIQIIGHKKTIVIDGHHRTGGAIRRGETKLKMKLLFCPPQVFGLK